MDKYVERLLRPDRLHTALDVAVRPCTVPARPGVYAWIDEPPPAVGRRMPASMNSSVRPVRSSRLINFAPSGELPCPSGRSVAKLSGGRGQPTDAAEPSA